WRAWRFVCGTRVLGTWPRRRVYVPDEHRASVDRSARGTPELVPRCIVSRRDYLGISRRWLHHRSTSLWHSFRRGDYLLAGNDACDQVLRPARREHTYLSIDDSHSPDDPG